MDFDLLFWEPGERELQRVQVKYTTSDREVIVVRRRSHSLTNGKVRATKHYTSQTIDCLAVFDATTQCVLYIPAGELGSGMTSMHVRLVPARNNQRLRVRMADRYLVPTIASAGP